MPTIPAETLERLPALRAAVAAELAELLTPALVIDLDAVRHNITAFVRHIGDPARWRPHVKTLKQGHLVQLLMRKKVTRFKCATVDELAMVLDAAERVDPDGRVDALLAYPLQAAAFRAVAAMVEAYEGARIRILADGPDHLEALDGWSADAALPRPIDVLLDVDTGMRRTGSTPATWTAAAPSPQHLRLMGVHGYEGHLGWADREAAHEGYRTLVELMTGIRGTSRDPALVVTSGTHAFDHALAFDGFAKAKFRHEVSPGTLVLSDLRSADAARAVGLRQAAFVLSRVVARPGEDRITLDAGSKALNPDCRAPGCALLDVPAAEPLDASEEHRPVRVPGSRPDLGTPIWLMPEHVCTTVNLYRSVLYLDGGRVRRGSIDAMSRSQFVGDRRP